MLRASRFMLPSKCTFRGASRGRGEEGLLGGGRGGGRPERYSEIWQKYMVYISIIRNLLECNTTVSVWQSLNTYR